MDYTTNLNRFIEAQNSPGFAGYNNAIEEIRRGKKLSLARNRTQQGG